jgi:hypothetical protein
MSPARRALARRSALALGWGAAAFLAAQLVLGLAVERWLPALRDPEYAAKVGRLRARRAEAPGRPLVLVLGSSRVQMGLRGGSLGCDSDGGPALVFNFGLSGAGPFVEALCLRRLLAEGVRPDLLVLEVLPPALSQPGDHPIEEEWLDGARLRSGEAAFLARYHSDPQRALRQWVKGRGLPCVWHPGNLRHFLAPGPAGSESGPEYTLSAMDPHGWLPYCREDVTPELRRRHTDFARHQYANAFGEFRLAGRPARALADTLARCRREGIPVALLVMPEGPAFRAHYTPSMRAGIDAHLRDLSERWGVPLIDARDWLDEDAFWDSHHLLPRGATAFTERFERDALGPLLRSLPRR